MNRREGLVVVLVIAVLFVIHYFGSKPVDLGSGLGGDVGTRPPA